MEIGNALNPNSPEGDIQVRDLQTAARAIGSQLHILRAGNAGELDTAFTTLARVGVQAILVAADPSFSSQRNHIVALATRLAVPAIYEARGYAVAGGLMSYGPNLADMYRQAGRARCGGSRAATTEKSSRCDTR